MFLTFVNAVGVVMFPLLRRTNQEKLPNLFVTLRNLFVPITYGILLFYVPAKYILAAWLPEYAESLKFMGILFPIIIYEGRMSLLINTYLKALRKEKTILFVNLTTLSLSLILSVIIIFGFGNLTWAVGLILISLAFRCNFAELFLCKSMNIPIIKALIIETSMTVLFILSNLFFGGSFISTAVYGVCYLLYLLVNHKKMLQSFNEFRGLLKGT